MHLFDVATLFVVLTLVGVEFSVPAFVNPAAWRLEPESQLKMLSRFALVLGKVMPVWYPVSTLLLVIQTSLYWHTPRRATLLAAAVIWMLVSVGSSFLLVPLNNRVSKVLLIGSECIGFGTGDIECALPLSPSRWPSRLSNNRLDRAG